MAPNSLWRRTNMKPLLKRPFIGLNLEKAGTDYVHVCDKVNQKIFPRVQADAEIRPKTLFGAHVCEIDWDMKSTRLLDYTLAVSLFTLKLIRSGDSYNITDNVSFGVELSL